MEEAAVISAVALVGLAVALVNLIASRLRLPPPLIYLAVGVIGGRSVTSFFHPDELGHIFPIFLEVLVGLLVFEGAFAINVRYLRRVGGVVRNLLTVGLVVTFVSATLLTGVLGVLPWRTAMMFGALVTVTGPTVIGPLVRETRLNDRVRSVLLGEGVLIDPLGAILAIIVLHFAITGFHIDDIWWAPSRLIGGFCFGLAGFVLVRAVLRLHRVPSSREMTLLLIGASIAVFGFSERLLEGSALTAMATMGVALSASNLPHADQVREFEDEFSRILLAFIYVLAASTLELQLLFDLWPVGFLVVLGLMFVIRPLSVALCSWRSDLSWQERAYVSGVAPRGVVAVALAAFAAEKLGEELDGGHLAALAFLTVAVTIGVQSTYAAPLARRLGVRSMLAMVAGAGLIGRRVANRLSANGFDVVLVDPNDRAVLAARREGLRAEVGEAGDAALMERLDVEEATVAVATTDNDDANLLFSQFVLARNPDAEVYARVAQHRAMGTFRDAGIHAIGERDTVADAMMEAIGHPELDDLDAEADSRMIAEFPVGTGLNGRRVRDLLLPDGVLVVVVRRGDEEMIPAGDTELHRDDVLLLYGHADALREARADLALIQ